MILLYHSFLHPAPKKATQHTLAEYNIVRITGYYSVFHFLPFRLEEAP